MIFNKNKRITCPKCGSNRIIDLYYPITTLDEIECKKLLPIHRCKVCSEEFDFKEQSDIYRKIIEELAFNYVRRSI